MFGSAGSPTGVGDGGTLPCDESYRIPENSGKLEVAQHIADHDSARRTKLYDRRQDEISLDDVELN